MNKNILILSFSLVIAFTLSNSLQASTILVPTAQPTIQAGIDAATNGDTVSVAAGLYVENINFNGMTIVVTSENGAEVTTIFAAPNLLATLP